MLSNNRDAATTSVMTGLLALHPWNGGLEQFATGRVKEAVTIEPVVDRG
jgi:hypothetical protein